MEKIEALNNNFKISDLSLMFIPPRRVSSAAVARGLIIKGSLTNFKSKKDLFIDLKQNLGDVMVAPTSGKKTKITKRKGNHKPTRKVSPNQIQNK